MAEETITRAARTCEHRQPNEDPCGADAPYLVSVGSRKHDAQASCERHLGDTVGALEGAEDRAAILAIAAPAPALTALAEAADARDRFREQARLLGEGKAEWLCEACEVIHPWRDGGRFTAACPVCGWPMVPTSVSARALAEARDRARGAEAKLAAIRQLEGSPGWATPAEVQRKVLAIISEAAAADPGAPEAIAAERERICAALAARRETLTRPGWGLRRPANVDVVPWDVVAEVLGAAAAADGEALARVRHLGKCWTALPADTAASLTLRHAGAELLARIEGGRGVV